MDNQACDTIPGNQYPPLEQRVIGGALVAVKEIDLKRHKELTTLAYRVKDFIDANGGLSDMESCMFGDMMVRIIRLK